MKLVFGVLLALGLATLVAAQEPVAEVTEPLAPAEMLARLQEIPRTLTGWTLQPQPYVCDRKCLPEHLPYDAEAILSYNYVWSVSVSFIPNEPQHPLMVDIFRMDDPLDAFGVYSHARTSRAIPAAIRSESYWSGDQLHLWRGLFYVRVTPTVTDDVLKAAALAAGEAVAARLPLPPELPLMMRLMPESRGVTSGLRYDRQNLLGQVALGDGLVNQYLEDGTTFTMALLRAPDTQAAAKVFATASALLAEGTEVKLVPMLGKEAHVIHSPSHGLCYVMLEGIYTAIALGVHDQQTAEGLLRITGTSIRITR